MSLPYTDRPYIYTFDGDTNALINGSNYNNLIIPVLNDSDFVCRRIVGFPNIGTKIQLKRYSLLLSGGAFAMGIDYAVAPEYVYQANSEINFDLYTANLANNPNTSGQPNYYSQLAFQGVRRFPQPQPDDIQFRPKRYQYQLTATINHEGRVSPAFQSISAPTTVYLAFNDFDFELQVISIVAQLNSNIVSSPYIPSKNLCKLWIYDANGNQVSTQPVVDTYLNSSASGVQSQFPYPSLLYPLGSQIKIDIFSLLATSQLPCTFTFTFNGVWRLPS